MSNKKRVGLMLVDNPKLLFRTLCNLKNNSTNIHTYKKELETTMNRTTPIHIKTAHTYFYTARIYGLLVKSNKEKRSSSYRTSSTAKYICDLYMDKERIIEYQKALRTLLLNNEKKGMLFHDFLDYVKRPKKVKEIYKEYKTLTGKTLIAWCLEANLIRQKSHIVSYNNMTIENPPNIDFFFNSVLKSYMDMQKTEMFGIKKIYVDIEELRLRVTCELGIENNDFDKYMTIILNSPLGKNVTLDGGPPILYKNKSIFRYNRKNYLYLSIRNP